jgi:hypothetical protein
MLWTGRKVWWRAGDWGLSPKRVGEREKNVWTAGTEEEWEVCERSGLVSGE